MIARSPSSPCPSSPFTHTHRADPSLLLDLQRRPRARGAATAGPLADARAAAGDRELLPNGMSARGYYDRAYRPERPGERGGAMDDLAWYEGRYPDSAGAPGGAGRGGAGAGRGGAGGGERVTPKRNPRSFLPSADEP